MTETSEQLAQRSKGVLAGGVGHDLRREFGLQPIYTARARGARKWDVDGKEYVDFKMGQGSLLLGHAHREVLSSVSQALASGSHFGDEQIPQIEWAESICDLVPTAERVRFVNSGTEATYLAIRVARALTGRRFVLTFARHFHGWHDGVLSGRVSDAAGWIRKDDVVVVNQDDRESIANQLESEKFAGVMLEPSGASWGREPITLDFLAWLRAETAKTATLLIFDEVITGFRWAPGGAQDRFGVMPDVTCLGKIVAGGLPGAAVAGSAHVMSVFESPQKGRIPLFGTFAGNPTSAAAGIATLLRVRNDDAVGKAEATAVRLRERLSQVMTQLAVNGHVYGVASTFHVFLEPAARSTGEAPSSAKAQTAGSMPPALIGRYQSLLRSAGVDLMSGTGGVVSTAHTDDDLDVFESAFRRALQELQSDRLIQSY